MKGGMDFDGMNCSCIMICLFSLYLQEVPFIEVFFSLFLVFFFLDNSNSCPLISLKF